jgi:hypothetical protein
MFLHVWLKRQEIEIAKTRILAQGLADASHVGKAFSDYQTKVLPFMKQAQAAGDAELKKAMDKEVAKGAISFQQVKENFFKRRATELSMPDSYRARLRDSVAARRSLRK